jgi:hypothetical protein
MFQTESSKSTFGNHERDEATNHKFQSLIDRALDIAIDSKRKDNDATDDLSTSWELYDEKPDDCSFSTTGSCYDDRTVDSLILTRQRLPNLYRHSSPNVTNVIISSGVVTLEIGQPPLEEDDDKDDDERLEPLSNSQPVEELVTKRRLAVSSNNSLMLWTRNDISPCQGIESVRVDTAGVATLMKAQAEACLPKLVRVETDESLRYERGLDDDEDEDDSFASYGSDVLLGEEMDSDWDPFDDEIDSIAVNKLRMAKNQIHAVDQGHENGSQVSL